MIITCHNSSKQTNKVVRYGLWTTNSLVAPVSAPKLLSNDKCLGKSRGIVPCMHVVKKEAFCDKWGCMNQKAGDNKFIEYILKYGISHLKDN